MKRIIKNKVYDTDTAQRLGEYAPNPNQSDFHYFCETLYRKKTGVFFCMARATPPANTAVLAGRMSGVAGRK